MNYALITGASSGIGRCYAHELARRGYNIVAVSNQESELLAVTTELRNKYNISAHYIFADLAAPNAAESIFERCTKEGWQVDILICNAGMLLFSTLLRTEPNRLTTIIALHCTTTTRLCRYFGEVNFLLALTVTNLPTNKTIVYSAESHTNGKKVGTKTEWLPLANILLCKRPITTSA